MKPIEYIRREIFGVTQAEFAQLAGVNQSSVSRWEKHGVPLSLGEMHAIRRAATERSIAWNDSWFFETPGQAA